MALSNIATIHYMVMMIFERFSGNNISDIGNGLVGSQLHKLNLSHNTIEAISGLEIPTLHELDLVCGRVI